jgi:malto-oligosyltrehalose synthase
VTADYRLPTDTYRLQLHAGFPLTAARDIMPYLARLGIDTCYTSPYFTAAPGSTHGYDVCDHNEINPELGGEPAFAAFAAALDEHRLHHLVDFVPNHMGVGSGNARWNDLLENGPGSQAAPFFDVDWTPAKPELHAKLLVPILGDQYGRVLERGELQLALEQGALILRYFDQWLPINPSQAPRVYRLAAERVGERLGADNPHLHEFLSIVTSLEKLPPHTERDPERIAERQREKEVARNRLLRLLSDEPAVREAIEEAIRVVNGTPGNAASLDRLHELLEAQAYRLAYWRTASHEINYRRFFDVNTLAGIRVEVPEVFAATHQLLGRLIREGRVHGVRVDHPDGLFDPARYFEMLQALASASSDPGEPPAAGGQRLYVVAEKILSGRERLPGRWRVDGTTGYNYLNDLNGIFVDSAQERRMRRVYQKVTGHGEVFDAVLYAAKRLIMETAMTSELTVLARMLDRISESNRRSRDFTLESMRDVIIEVVACFPAYRTYVDEHGWTPDDRAVVERAIARARRRNPAMEASLFDFFREVVLPRDPEDESAPRLRERRDGYPPADQAEAHERLRFAMKLQQYTGPVQAKGLEDTAFYRYNALLSLNEVGGDPSRFGRSVDEFHHLNAERARSWPGELLATSTHDTKMGEDVRARINTLSEMPDEWGREVSRWMRLNRAARSIVDGEPAPDRADEYRFYQALVGVWPPDAGDANAAPLVLVERLREYMLKAVREAKVHTSWLTPNQAYEEALAAFVERTLAGPGGARFLPAFLPFERRIALLGMINSLAQLGLKLGSPGVPDFYQGAELWDLTLVDPDNRRPVDFAARARALDDVERVLAEPADRRSQAIGQLLQGWPDGRIKMLVTTAGLRLRRERPALFRAGTYLPLPTDVTVAAGAVAFARSSDGGDAVLFVAPRLCSRLADGGRTLPLGGDAWKTSRIILPPALGARRFRHVLTGAEILPTVTSDAAWVLLGEVFDTVPVAMLVSD